jgi:hypothetical protein
MDRFFFQNRLSSWLDGSLSLAEQKQLEEILKKDPEFSKEAEAFAAAVRKAKQLKVSAPPGVMAAALLAKKPPASLRPLLFLLVPVATFAVGAGIAWVLPQESEEGTSEAAMTQEETPVEEAPAEEVTLEEAPVEEAAQEEVPVEVIDPEAIGSSKVGLPHYRSPSSSRQDWKPSSKSRVVITIPKGEKWEYTEDPEATDWVVVEEEPKTVVTPYKYTMEASSPDTVLKSLATLASRLGGQLLSRTGGAKAPHPIDPGAVVSIQLQVPASNLGALISGLSSYGTTTIISQPAEPPASGMVAVHITVAAPP